MPSPLRPPSFSFIKTFLFLPFFISTYLASNDAEEYTACAPFSCGNINDISHPFWSSNQPDYCGHPRFKLDCQQDNLTIDIMSQKFQIIDMNQATQILKIARLNLLGNPCPKEYTSVSMDFGFFKYTSNDENITLLYNCDFLSHKSPVNATTSMMFTCPIGGDLPNAYLSTDLSNFSDLGCKNNITAPVLKEAVQSFIKDDTFGVGNVLDEGFEVEWSGVDGDQCDSCIQSGGRCGHNASINEFICLCPNQQPSGEVCDYSPAWSPLSAPTPTLSVLPTNQANYSISPSHHAANTLNVGSAHTFNVVRKIAIGVGGSVITGLLICITSYCFRSKSLPRQVNFWLTTNGNQDIEAFLKNHGALSLKRYKFSDVKKMTNSFKVKLGQGGFGAVYKGKLLTGCPVAVKILNASKENGEEFINEVASISRTSHVNVVTLLGFCFEGRKKGLIYEFMSNGSLEKFIYKNRPETTPLLSWEILYQIAKGIARGLEYLHRGCNTRILHFDIKPHNILLDENFCPKISDFGLAKLCPRKESIISMSDARGTIGYVAPEVCNRHFGGVSHKSDVYSYGMLLLDMVGERKNANLEGSHTSDIYFPEWIYKRLEQGTHLGLDGVVATEENEIAKRMTMIGLWCIQTFPNDRPTMSRVIDMLEGNINLLEMPPKPVMTSPARSVLESSTTSTT